MTLTQFCWDLTQGETVRWEEDEQATTTGSMHICNSLELVSLYSCTVGRSRHFTFFWRVGFSCGFWKGPACVRMHGIRYHSFFTPPYMAAVSDRHNIVQPMANASLISTCQ